MYRMHYTMPLLSYVL